MTKYVFSILSILFLGNLVFSQTTNLGEPYLLKSNTLATQKFYRTAAVNNDFELKAAEDHTKIHRFGKEFNVSIDILAASEKTILPNGNILHQFGIECKNAVSINLQFDQFNLPEGAVLYIVDLLNRKFDGAYTHFNNNKSKMLGTEVLMTDKIIIEVVIPEDKKDLATLNLGMIVHGFKSLKSIAKSLNSSGICEIDVNCPLGLGWEEQRNSVALVITGGSSCTGSLINNTSGVVIPYLLTANHCGTSPGAWVFRFRWESPEGQVDCGTSAPSVNSSTNLSINGATLCATNSASDFTLTLLNQPPDPSWDVYYNGWDKTDIPATQLTVIHHPNGDIKKISRDNSTAVSTSFNGGAPNSHWEAPSWDYGATEGGSSGSPLFNQDHRTIGQLHGGNSACGEIASNMNDEFGKFYVSWDGGGLSTNSLKSWLDPININPDFIDGINPLIPKYTLDGGIGNITITKSTLCGGILTPKIKIFNAGKDTILSASISYSIDNGPFEIYNWTGKLKTNQFNEITLPDFTVEGGDHILTSIFNNTTGIDENSKNDTLVRKFNTISEGEILKLDMTLFCDANENNWELINDNQITEFDGGSYTDTYPTVIKDSFCVNTGCYTFKLHDSYGDGISSTSSTCDSGFYTLTNSKNEIISELKPENSAFGFTYSSTFCISLTSDPAIKLFPNPTNSYFSTYSDITKIYSVEILTITGQQIYFNQSIDNSTKIDVKNLSKGIYLVHIESETGKLIKRLIID